MNAKRISKILGFIGLLVLSLSCVKKKVHQEDSILKAYRLIDSQRTDEAIDLMEAELEQNRNNDQVRLILASAYAHKGGIKIQKLIPLFSSGEKLNQLNKQKEPLIPLKETNEAVSSAIFNFSKILNRTTLIMETFMVALPSVSAAQAIYIQHAINLINEVGNKLKSEDILYKVILEVVLFKHILIEKFIGVFVDSNDKIPQPCRLDLAYIDNEILQIGKILVTIYQDLAVVIPAEAKSMYHHADETTELISDFSFYLGTTALIDESFHLFFRKTAAQNGFNKIAACQ